MYQMTIFFTISMRSAEALLIAIHEAYPFSPPSQLSSFPGAVSLQYLGAVHIYFGRRSGKFSSTPDLTITGQETFDNFGYTLKAADVNQDGYKDVIIASPFSPSGGRQRGHVDIVLAQADQAAIKRSISVTGSQDYEWFGYAVDFVVFQKRSLMFVGAPAYR